MEAMLPPKQTPLSVQLQTEHFSLCKKRGVENPPPVTFSGKKPEPVVRPRPPHPGEAFSPGKGPALGPMCSKGEPHSLEGHQDGF